MTLKTPLMLAAAAALVLVGCSTATPYQPLGASGSTQGGYSDQMLTQDRFRVSFAGNTMTSRQTVENYLLYRAAELTEQRGYDWFSMVDRNTDHKSRTYVDRPVGPGAYGWWGPSWRYHGRFGWRSWDPWFGDPFWGDTMDVHTVDQYEATAEIVMHHGSPPPDSPRAFVAREVLANLGPTIVRPS